MLIYFQMVSEALGEAKMLLGLTKYGRKRPQCGEAAKAYLEDAVKAVEDIREKIDIQIGTRRRRARRRALHDGRSIAKD